MRVKITSLVLMVLLLAAPLSMASARNSDGLSVPISGTFTDSSGGIGKFAGTFTITRFAVVSNSIHAVGAITGTLTDSTGKVVATGVQTVSLPVTAGAPAGGTANAAPAKNERQVTFTKASYDPSEPPPFVVGAKAAAPAPQQICQILRLAIGAIDLNLLGLVVHLDPVLLIITAVAAPGNLLGNLLCAIVGLLDGPGGPLSQIVFLLNQLLAILT